MICVMALANFEAMLFNVLLCPKWKAHEWKAHFCWCKQKSASSDG
jgi:hypothetical protein